MKGRPVIVVLLTVLVAIKDGKFIKVGSGAEMKGLIGDETKVVDLGGKFMMPGVHDTHVHLPLGSDNHSIFYYCIHLHRFSAPFCKMFME